MENNNIIKEKNMKKETYKIKGMHCASCVMTIERVLKKLMACILL